MASGRPTRDRRRYRLRVAANDMTNRETIPPPPRGLWPRCRAFLGHYFGGLYNRVDEHHIFLMASGLAFSLIICAIPLVLVIFSVLGVLLDRPAIREEIELFIDRAVPLTDFADFIKDIVFRRVQEFVLYRSLAGILGGIGLVLASSTLFSAMRTVLNQVYRVGPEGSIWMGKLRDIGLIALVLVYFLLSTFLLPAVELVKEFAAHVELLRSLQASFIESIALGVATFLLIFGTFLIIYLTVPHKRPPIRAILVSSFWASLLWVAAQQLFGYYITHFVTFKRIYGTYALLLATAFWFYYTAILFIIGAEIGQLYRERKGLTNVAPETSAVPDPPSTEDPPAV